jgi:ADP-heptose:LPS heptosyltransferase
MPKHILVIKPDALGDFVLATPALALLRKTLPDSFISLLVGERSYDLARFCPDVDQVIKTPVFTEANLNDRLVAESTEHTRYFLHHRALGLPEVGFVLRWDTDFYGAGALLYRLGIPVRIGYSENCSPMKQQLNRGYDAFYTDPVSDQSVEHEVMKALRLIQPAAEPENVRLELARYETADATLRSDALRSGLGITNGFIAVGIGSSLGFKNLSYEKWCDIITRVRERHQQDFVLFGGSHDAPLADRLAADMGCISVAGMVQPHELFSLIKHAALALCVDSFVKHVAAAGGVPTIELSSHSAAGDERSEFGGVRFGAWGNRSAMVKPHSPRQGCLADRCLKQEPHCILDIDVAEVASCVERFLDRS